MKRLRSLLDRLPSLRDSVPRTPKCKICDEACRFFDAVDFNKYCGEPEPYRSDIAGISVPYFRCDACDFTFTDFFDEWTTTDFGKYIYNTDYELVDPEYGSIRPAYTADRVAELLADCEHLRILDYGAGSGQFGREMKQRGFSAIADFDPFSSPTPPNGTFDLVCMLEVIEHVADPIAVLRDVFTDLLSSTGIVLLTQSIQPTNFGEIRGRWWYLGPRNGHISTFSERTFSKICDRLDLVFIRVRPGYYAFGRRSDFDGAPAHLRGPCKMIFPAGNAARARPPASTKRPKKPRGSSRIPLSA